MGYTCKASPPSGVTLCLDVVAPLVDSLYLVDDRFL